MTELRRLGESDLAVPPIIFGAWAVGGWYWGGTDDRTAIAAIQAGIDAGLTAIDTAPVYGFGHSETVVGQAIRGRRAQVQLLTKVGLRWDSTEGAHFFDDAGQSVYRNLRPAAVRQEVEASLRRLGVEVLDLVQCHWPDPSCPIPDTMGALADLHREGKLRAVGVSNYSPEQLALAQAALGDIPLASTQPRYSLLDREIEAGVLPWVRAHHVGTIVYSPLEQGLLTGRVGVDREFPDDDGRATDPAFAPERRQQILAALEEVRDLAAGKGATFAQLAAAWCFHQPGVTAAIVGARSPQQAAENAGAMHLRLTPEELDRLSSVFEVRGLVQR